MFAVNSTAGRWAGQSVPDEVLGREQAPPVPSDTYV